MVIWRITGEVYPEQAKRIKSAFEKARENIVPVVPSKPLPSKKEESLALDDDTTDNDDTDAEVEKEDDDAGNNINAGKGIVRRRIKRELSQPPPLPQQPPPPPEVEHITRHLTEPSTNHEMRYYDEGIEASSSPGVILNPEMELPVNSTLITLSTYRTTPSEMVDPFKPQTAADILGIENTSINHLSVGSGTEFYTLNDNSKSVATVRYKNENGIGLGHVTFMRVNGLFEPDAKIFSIPEFVNSRHFVHILLAKVKNSNARIAMCHVDTTDSNAANNVKILKQLIDKLANLRKELGQDNFNVVMFGSMNVSVCDMRNVVHKMSKDYPGVLYAPTMIGAPVETLATSEHVLSNLPISAFVLDRPKFGVERIECVLHLPKQ